MHDAYNLAEACVAPQLRDWYAEQLTAVSTECRKSLTATAHSVYIILGCPVEQCM